VKFLLEKLAPGGRNPGLGLIIGWVVFGAYIMMWVVILLALVAAYFKVA